MGENRSDVIEKERKGQKKKDVGISEGKQKRKDRNEDRRRGR